MTRRAGLGTTSLIRNKHFANNVVLIFCAMLSPCTRSVCSATPSLPSVPLPPLASGGFVQNHDFRDHEPEQNKQIATDVALLFCAMA